LPAFLQKSTPSPSATCRTTARTAKVLDRLSFHRFPGFAFGDSVPDAKTIWAFREGINVDDRARILFDKFDAFLREYGFQAHAMASSSTPSVGIVQFIKINAR